VANVGAEIFNKYLQAFVLLIWLGSREAPESIYGDFARMPGAERKSGGPAKARHFVCSAGSFSPGRAWLI
jgi:hypothetical protein